MNRQHYREAERGLLSYYYKQAGKGLSKQYYRKADRGLNRQSYTVVRRVSLEALLQATWEGSN